MPQKMTSEELKTEMFGAPIEPNNIHHNNLIDILKQTLGIVEFKSFIGHHPVALNRERLDLLLNEDYLVCEKSDGIRVMLLLSGQFTYLYDRTNKFHMTCINTRTKAPFLFDGEMYRTKDTFVFAIFDVLIFDGKSVLKRNLIERLSLCQSFANTFRSSHRDSALIKFKIVFKTFIKSYAFKSILDAISSFDHKNDGLIFTPVSDPYALYAISRILKWKPPHLNTIDFKIRPIFPKLFGLFCTICPEQFRLFVKGANCPTEIELGRYFLTEGDFQNSGESFSNIRERLSDGSIGEFGFDSEKEVLEEDGTFSKGGWVLHRIREDKLDPNNVKIAIEQIESLADEVGEAELVANGPEMQRNFKSRQNKSP
ncbi:MCE1 [Enterospora canceri]|uniref:mRNA guanylyltransferase n=1 Tax=Enterospora canceri TaxID=1081671 RepID=A0A1Y1S857_9MICR|nr:MCE1 [Enterospora canceri]